MVLAQWEKKHHTRKKLVSTSLIIKGATG